MGQAVLNILHGTDLSADYSNTVASALASQLHGSWSLEMHAMLVCLISPPPAPDACMTEPQNKSITSLPQIPFRLLPLARESCVAISTEITAPIAPFTRRAGCTRDLSPDSHRRVLNEQRDSEVSPNRQHDQLSCSHGLCAFLFMDWSADRFQRH